MSLQHQPERVEVPHSAVGARDFKNRWGSIQKIHPASPGGKIQALVQLDTGARVWVDYAKCRPI
jgi:hypothetical protein